jgi:hypothetical protein
MRSLVPIAISLSLAACQKETEAAAPPSPAQPEASSPAQPKPQTPPKAQPGAAPVLVAPPAPPIPVRDVLIAMQEAVQTIQMADSDDLVQRAKARLDEAILQLERNASALTATAQQILDDAQKQIAAIQKNPMVRDVLAERVQRLEKLFTR